ncbi:hypothetical protein D3C72_1665660 [compost metagenome]
MNHRLEQVRQCEGLLVGGRNRRLGSRVLRTGHGERLGHGSHELLAGTLQVAGLDAPEVLELARVLGAAAGDFDQKLILEDRAARSIAPLGFVLAPGG